MSTSHMPEDRFPTGEWWESKGLICWKLSCSSLLWRRGNRGLMQFRTYFFRLQIPSYAVAARWVLLPHQFRDDGSYFSSSFLLIYWWIICNFFYRASVRVRFFLEAEVILLKKIKILIYINCELDSYTCNAKIIAL